MGSPCRLALKEGARTCRRLGEGRQVLLLRKGGLLDGRDGFRPQEGGFLLFPTRFHEEGEIPPDTLRLDFCASVEDSVPVDDLARLDGLEEEHGLGREALERRFHYGKAPGLLALLLRVARLSAPAVLHDAARYDGCRSWVDLDDPVRVDGSVPVLPDADFEARAAHLTGRLRG